MNLYTYSYLVQHNTTTKTITFRCHAQTAIEANKKFENETGRIAMSFWVKRSVKKMPKHAITQLKILPKIEKYIHFNAITSPCGKRAKGFICEGKEGENVFWHCGCWESHGVLNTGQHVVIKSYHCSSHS